MTNKVKKELDKFYEARVREHGVGIGNYVLEDLIHNLIYEAYELGKQSEKQTQTK